MEANLFNHNYSEQQLHSAGVEVASETAISNDKPCNSIPETKEDILSITENTFDPEVIESWLRSQLGINDAIVDLFEDHEGNRQMVGYLVASDSKKDTGALREEIEKQIPQFTMPSVFIWLDQLPNRPLHLICVSGDDLNTITIRKQRLCDYIAINKEFNLSDIAYTLNTDDYSGVERRFFIAGNTEELQLQLEIPGNAPAHYNKADENCNEVVFMFPGQGTQFVNMGYSFYINEPVFRYAVDECALFLSAEMNRDIREIIYASNDTGVSYDEINAPDFANAAIFVVEYALAKLWMSWGIVPTALIGEGIGEYVAGHIAGVFNLRDALYLLTRQEHSTVDEMPFEEKSGSHLQSSFEETNKIPNVLNENNLAIYPAKIGSPEQNNYEPENLHNNVTPIGLANDQIKISDHSGFKVNFQEPEILLISSVTGNWITDDDAVNPDYWINHFSSKNGFSVGVSTLVENSFNLMLECGPGHSLSELVRQVTAGKTIITLSSMGASDSISPYYSLLNAIGQMWVNDIPFNWEAFYAGQKRKRIDLRSNFIEDLIPEQAIESPVEIAIKTTTAETFPDESATALLAEHQTAIPVVGVLDNTISDPETDDKAVDDHIIVNSDENIALNDLDTNVLEPAEFLDETASASELVVEPAKVDFKFEYLTPLKKSGKLPPLFVILAHDLDTQPFFSLSELLDEGQPLVVLQRKGENIVRENFKTIEEIAGEYFDEIIAYQPGDNILLAGFSYGGYIAYELAKQLKASGKKVRMLAMVDTYVHPASQGDDDVATLGSRLLWQFPKAFFALNSFIKYPKQTIEYQLFNAKDRYKQLTSDVAYGKSDLQRKVFERCDFAYKNYVFSDYHGDLDLFKVKSHIFYHDDLKYLGWKQIVKGSVRIHETPGDHKTFLTQPNNKIFAQMLQQTITSAIM